MDLYKQKPKQILARQLTMASVLVIANESEGKVVPIRSETSDYSAIVYTPNGPCFTRYGDYVIKNPRNEWCVMHSEDFRDKYEEF